MHNTPVLLLNASHEALRIITLRRAIELVYLERVAVVAVRDGEMRSPSVTIPIPSVVRLKEYVKVPYRAKFPLTRRTLAFRDDNTCQVEGCTKVGSTMDHVIPRARGGKHRWENVVAMCPKHNHAKGDRLLSEIGWKLKKEPKMPSGDEWLLIGLGMKDSLVPEWEDYISV